MSTLAGDSNLSKVRGAEPPSFVRPSRALWLVLVLLAVAFVVIYQSFFQYQLRWAIAEPSDWGHTLLVPLLAVWFVSLRRDRLLDRPLVPSWSGLFILLLGITIYMLGSVGPKQLFHPLVRAGGVCFSLLGLIVSFAGWRCFKECSFAFCYLFAFGIVITKRIMNPITNDLQDLSASGAWLLLFALGYDVDLAGNTLTVYDGAVAHPLNVAEACSGMRMLVAFLALGTAMAYLGLDRNWQRTLLILLGIPVAVFVNVLRVVTLGLLSRYDAGFVSGEFHMFVGMVWLIPAFLVFLLLMWIVRKLVVESPSTPTPAGSGERGLRFRSSPLPLMASCLAMLTLGAVGVQAALVQLDVFLSKKPVPLVASLDTIPSRISEWKQVGSEPEYSDAILESLGTSQFIDRSYSLVDGLNDTILKIHISYYTGTIDAVPHIPERCWHVSGLSQVGNSTVMPLEIGQQGWDVESEGAYRKTSVVHPITGVESRVTMPKGEPTLQLTVFEDPKQPDLRMLAGYFFVANGQLTPNAFGVRSLAFNWSDEYAYYCKVQFSAIFRAESPDQEFTGEFMGMINQVTSQLLPQLMRCLPDWQAIISDEPEPDLEPASAPALPSETEPR